jgi:hypothetical protein
VRYQAGVRTFGRGYSIAACSALTELVTGKTISECQEITPDQVITALDGVPEEERFCADLPVATLRDALVTIPFMSHLDLEFEIHLDLGFEVWDLASPCLSLATLCSMLV